jgi:hypothetical protein
MSLVLHTHTHTHTQERGPRDSIVMRATTTAAAAAAAAVTTTTTAHPLGARMPRIRVRVVFLRGGAAATTTTCYGHLFQPEHVRQIWVEFEDKGRTSTWVSDCSIDSIDVLYPAADMTRCGGGGLAAH